MAPFNPGTKKAKATQTPSSSKRSVAKRSSKKTTRAGISDRISALPNNMLCCILTLLTVRDATRTTVLSSEWRKLFSSSECLPDSIDDSNLRHGRRRPRSSTKHQSDDSDQWRSNAITSTLTGHQGSIRRFIIQRTFPLHCTVSRWLKMLSQKGVIEELVLEMPVPKLRLPRSIFNCSSLQSLSLANWRWPRTGPNDVQVGYLPAWTFPRLTELTLSWMDMTVEDIENLLLRCPALTSLSIRYPLQGGSLHIRGENLLSLTIVDKYKCWNYLVRVVDAPKLERLLWWPPAPLRIAYDRTLRALTPRLHTLGIFKQSAIGLALEQVRTIALFTNVDNFKEVQETILLLHNFPNLETLHMQMKNGSETTKGKLISFEEMPGAPVACLEKSLKTIVLRVHNLVRQKLAFANYLLGAAKTLKAMLIYNKRMVGELLRPESRGSSDAQIMFLGDNKCTVEMNLSASNFKLADPFMP